MPWTAADAKRHIKGLTPDQAKKWAKIANAALASCQDKGGDNCDGYAIRVANSAVKKAVDASTDDTPLYTSLLKQDTPLRYTLGIVYEPMEEDLQGDFAKASTIRQAQWEFMRRLQGGKTLTKWAALLLDHIVKAVESTAPVRLDITDMLEEVTKAKRMLGDQHSSWDEGLGEVVECYCMPCDGVIGEEFVKHGTWMLGVIWAPAYFAKIQAGERTGYSMGGRGRRKWVEDMANAA